MLVNRQYSITYQVVGSLFGCGVQVSFNTNNDATTNYTLLLKAIAENHNNNIGTSSMTGLIKAIDIIILSATRMVDTP